jgi:tetratricopeptide (TPR) repeat protein
VALSDLIERGIKAYLLGRAGEARTAFTEALQLDPRNASARWYLDKIDPAAAPSPNPVAPAPAGPSATTPAGEPEAAASPAVAAPAKIPAPPAAPAHAPARTEAAPAAPDAARPARAPARTEAAPAAPDAAPVRPAPTGVGAQGGVAPAPEPEYAASPWDYGPAAPATIVLEPYGGLDLGAIAEKSELRPLVPEGTRPAPARRTDVEVWLAAAKELFALGDFSGSLELIEKILQVDPDHGEARDYLRQNEATLISMYESKLGPLSRVPRLAIKPEEVLWLNLDHRAGFLLAQIDGAVDYESLFALSGLPRLDTARILANLIADGVISS